MKKLMDTIEINETARECETSSTIAWTISVAAIVAVMLTLLAVAL